MQDFVSLKARLPLGESNFASLRQNNCLYVDKTKLIYELAKDRIPKFLSRPRRFGKSTLVSTLEELFTYGVKGYDGHDSYFKGLAIEKLWQDEGQYYVMHFNFAKICYNCLNVKDFEAKLTRQILNFAQKFKVKIPEQALTFDEKFDSLLNALPLNSIVLLVDEYDAPLTYFLESEKSDYDLISALLRSFYGLLKDNSGKFRFIFITGITRYKDAYLLTAGNAILDISQDPTFSEICGYTRSEIKTYFKDHLCFAAAQIYKLPANKIDPLKIDEFLDKLALWYDGYYFDACCSTKIFSLWSILNFFSSKNAIFDTYWYDSAGETTLLRKVFFKEDYFKILKLFENNQSVLVDLTKFKTPSPLPYMDPFVLLYQLGYLTLAKPYLGLETEPFTLDVELKFPNLEIENSFTKLLINNLPSYDPTLAQILKNCAKNLKEAINKQDLTSFVHELNRCFNHIPYDGQVIDNEALVNYLMGLFLIIILRKNVENNRHEASGRPDLIFNCENTTVVIENKFIADDNKKTSQKALLSAGKQILEHDYGNTLLRHEKLWRIALVFSGKKRQIIAFKDADLS